MRPVGQESHPMANMKSLVCGLAIGFLGLLSAGSCRQEPYVKTSAPNSEAASTTNSADATTSADSAGAADSSRESSPTQDVSAAPQTAVEYLSQREQLDQELWAAEVAAQRHEEPFIRLWDALRTLESEFKTFREFSFRELRFAAPRLQTTHPWDIREFQFDGDVQVRDWTQWLELLQTMEAQGYRLLQSEWHHSRFQPGADGQPAESTVSFVLDLKRSDPLQRISLRGNLRVVWADGDPSQGLPQFESLELLDASALVRDAAPVFQEILAAESNSQFPRVLPLLLYDLDGNGASEIILGGLNRVYWNDGSGRFTPEPLCSPAVEMFDAAVLGDFTGDGHVDLLCVGRERVPLLLEGDASGRFLKPPRKCADFEFELPKSFTAGDVDGDGDLDVWVGQYKFPYLDGAMPTPFYDSNDGYPSVLLLNDGQGNFRDATEQAGLAAHRNRRTYSSSLVDLDGDLDLDLMTVNDFCGVDVYENDGQGRFTNVSQRWLSDRHLFGMGHTIADYDRDGRLDMYLIGMSSTTARRLDRLQLGRSDHPDINAKRQVMGYGNRMLLGQSSDNGVFYQQAPWNDRIARTGWSWGTTSFDFDNDGYVDIYVANGHNSGQSARDYCTRYWCHDVYTGSSDANPELRKLFAHSRQELHQGQISWNGFEHNVLWMNRAGRDFINVAFLLGVGFEVDGRAVASDDLDNDGRPDLLTVRYASNGLSQVEYKFTALRNELDTDHHWVGVRLCEAITGRSPLGAVVRVTTASGQQLIRPVVSGDSFSTQHAPTVHFGLGAESELKEIHVRWPDGSQWSAASPAVDQYHDAR
jgi:enediyne biosynthesis protein E4